MIWQAVVLRSLSTFLVAVRRWNWNIGKLNRQVSSRTPSSCTGTGRRYESVLCRNFASFAVKYMLTAKVVQGTQKLSMPFRHKSAFKRPFSLHPYCRHEHQGTEKESGKYDKDNRNSTNKRVGTCETTVQCLDKTEEYLEATDHKLERINEIVSIIVAFFHNCSLL